MVTAVAVAKSLGYCPPELDTCRVSPKSDVYSYGVVSQFKGVLCCHKYSIMLFSGYP